MSIHYEAGAVVLHHGDCIAVMRELPDESIDAVVTDPPYALEFMGKGWDSFTPVEFEAWCAEWARECLRLLRPGGHLLAFGGSRTWHRLAAGIEDAGFEIRDSIAWLYGSGFPKSRNLEGEWVGWGTALKPAFEPIVVARKPLRGTVAANALAYGTGAINIRGTRVGTSVRTVERSTGVAISGNGSMAGPNTAREVVGEEIGRWPTNVVLDESQATELDRQSGTTVSRVGKPRAAASGDGWGMTAAGAEYDDEGGASRFFPTFRYEAKAPTSERPVLDGVQHPTVKPLDLMRWLVRLVTPPAGVVLEPFAGSGTTVEACLREGFGCVAIEREADYLPLIVQRIEKDHAVSLFDDLGDDEVRSAGWAS